MQMCMTPIVACHSGLQIGSGRFSDVCGPRSFTSPADRVRRGGGRGGGAVPAGDRQGVSRASGDGSRCAAPAGGGQSARPSVQLWIGCVRPVGAVNVGGAVFDLAAPADQASENDAGGGVAAFVRRRIRGEGRGRLVDVGVQADKKIALPARKGPGNRPGECRPIDWRGIFTRLTGRGSDGLGLTYAQASELTWPQLMHAMGISSNAVLDDELAETLVAKQDAIFDRIIARRRCLPVELLRMPAADLAAQICAETGGEPPAVEQLLSGIRRYAAAQR